MSGCVVDASALVFSDACYVAAAALTGYPLLTYGAHLGRAPNLPCEVEVLAG